MTRTSNLGCYTLMGGNIVHEGQIVNVLASRERWRELLMIFPADLGDKFCTGSAFSASARDRRDGSTAPVERVPPNVASFSYFSFKVVNRNTSPFNQDVKFKMMHFANRIEDF